MRYVIALLLTGCFSPNLPDCQIACGENNACGDDQSCSNGFCSSGPVCGMPDAGTPDAGTPGPDAEAQLDAQTEIDSWTAPDATPTTDAAWTWDGQYTAAYTAEPGGCFAYTYLRLSGVDADGSGTDQWYSDSGYTTLKWSSTVSANGNTLHFAAIDLGAGSFVNAWDATRTSDGMLTGTMTSTIGCTFAMTLTRTP